MINRDVKTVDTKPASIFKRIVATALIIQFIFQPVLVAAQEYKLEGGGEHAPDTIRPFVDGARNGVPVININATNSKGLSHNTFEHYNVSPSGLVLNNSATNVNTQAAGWIEGNPNLRAGSEASTILIEAIGASRSQLDGYIEAPGPKKADIIVANPNGITCNGCGFVNTARGVLTTGTPNINPDGSLQGYRVTGGDIEIQAGGLDGSGQQRIDLLGQAVKVYGQVKSQGQLNVAAGNHRVDHVSGEVTAIAQADVPEVAIDASALGGMYANQINLVVTGQGAGVNMVGAELIAIDSINLTADGDIRMAGTRLEAEQNDVVVNGGADLQIERHPASGNGSQWLSGGDLRINSLGHTTVEGSRLAADGSLVIGGESAASLSIREADLKSLRDIRLTAASITLENNRDVTLNGTTKAAIAANGDLSIEATGAVSITDTSTDSGAAADAAIGSTLVQGGSLALNGSEIVAQHGLTLRSHSSTGSLQVTDGSRLSSGGHIIVDAAGDAVLHSSILDAADRVALNAADLLDLNGVDISSLQQSELSAANVVMRNSEIDTATDLTVETTGTSGGINYSGLRLQADGAISLSGGSIAATENPAASQFDAGTGITLTATAPDGELELNSIQLASPGAISARGQNITLTQATINPGIKGSGPVDLTAADALIIERSRISSDSAIALRGETITLSENADYVNANGETVAALRSNQALRVQGDGLVSIHDSSLSGGGSESTETAVEISGAGLQVSNTTIGAKGNLLLDNRSADTALTVTDSELTSAARLDIRSDGNASLTDTALESVDTLTFDADGALSLTATTEHTISSQGEIRLEASDIALHNITMDTPDSVTLRTDTDTGVLAFDQTDIIADLDLILSAGQVKGGLNNTAGDKQLSTLVAGRNLIINDQRPGSNVDIRWSDIDARGELTVQGKDISLQDSTLVAGGDLVVTSQTGGSLDAGRALFSAGQKLAITGGDVDIHNQSVLAANDGIAVTGGAVIFTDSRVSSKAGGASVNSGKLTFSATEKLSLNGGEYTADTELQGTAPDITIHNATVAAKLGMILSGEGGSRADKLTVERATLIAAQEQLRLRAKEIKVTGELNPDGSPDTQLWAGGNIEIQGDDIQLKRSRLWAAQDVQIDRDGNGTRADLIRNTEGSITAYAGNLSLSATQVESVGKKPTFEKDAINETWSRWQEGNDVADVPGNTLKMIRPEFVESDQIVPAYREAYLELMVGLMNGTPLSTEAVALLSDSVLDESGEVKEAYTDSWQKMNAEAQAAGISDYDAYLKSLLVQSFERVIQAEVRDPDGNLVTPEVVETVTIVEADGSINPAYFDQYYGLWQAAISGGAIPGETLAIIQDGNKESNGQLKLAIAVQLDDVLGATAVGGYEIKYFLRGDKLNDDGILAELIAGGNIDIDADTFDNIHANVSAGGDISIQADTAVDNRSYGASQVLLEVHKKACFTCHEGRLQYGDSFGGRIQPAAMSIWIPAASPVR